MKVLKWLFLILLILVTAGCSTGEKVDEKPSGTKDTGKETVTESPDTFPLTGQSANGDAGRRAVAVMVNNHTQARPQSGLSKADVVYEMLSEGDITRFLAVFQSEVPNQVGPVRSARDYYMELAKGLDTIFICHGNSPDAKKLLGKGYIDNLNGLYYDGTLFHRSSDRTAPHNSYISFKDIEKGAKEKGYELNGPPKSFSFLTDEETESISGESAQRAEVTYGLPAYNVQYEYDENKAKYKRFSNGEQTVEYQSQEPVLLDNVLIIEAVHQVMDDKGRRKIDLDSGGKGLLLQKGKVNEVEWINEDGRIIPVKDGKEVGLVPGKTWVNIIPNHPGLNKSVTF